MIKEFVLDDLKNQTFTVNIKLSNQFKVRMFLFKLFLKLAAMSLKMGVHIVDESE